MTFVIFVIMEYLNGLNLETGWLVIFDRRSDLPPIEERTSAEEVLAKAGVEVRQIEGSWLRWEAEGRPVAMPAEAEGRPVAKPAATESGQ